MKKNVILLIEDDDLDVISVERSLSKLNIACELYTAYNGLEALLLLQGKAGAPPLAPLPDLILLDINMPRMNGIEFLRILRADDRLKHIKVFVMTTSGEERDRETMQELGISGYLIKPLNFNDNSKKTDSMDAFVQFHIGKIFREQTNTL
ncbi:response regulator [Inquilinus sp. KBS0705]|nr:response regulator [Inquilinus sp. KBS0705]